MDMQSADPVNLPPAQGHLRYRRSQVPLKVAGSDLGLRARVHLAREVAMGDLRQIAHTSGVAAVAYSDFGQKPDAADGPGW